MSTSNAKVITALRERLQIEREIKEMLNAHSEDHFSNQARRVAARGDQVVPVILHNLDRLDARLLGALGAVASFYPHRDQLLNKLYQAAADLDRPDRGRMSAILIMERFLGQETDPYLIGTLDNPRLMAIESIRDMLRESEREPSVLIDYCGALASQPEDAFDGVLETLLEVGGAQAVPVLSLLAQETRRSLARSALLALGRLPRPDAVRALQSILPMLPPDLVPVAKRSLLKLRLKQVPVDSLPKVEPCWRALVSPVDGEGNQIVWFVSDPDKHGDSAFLGVSINDGAGIVQAYGKRRVPSYMLPERREAGHVHKVSLGRSKDAAPGDKSPILHLLEAHFDYGRWLVRQGQMLGFQQQTPLPVEYCLLGPMIWQYDDAQVDVSPGHPPVQTYGGDLLPETSKLLAHPGFSGWFAHGPMALRYASRMLYQMPVLFAEGMSAWSVALAQEYFDEAMVLRYQRRLETMAEWLWRAEEPHLAGLATVTAMTLSTISPGAHPFALRIAELGLNLIVSEAQLQVQSNQKKEN